MIFEPGEPIPVAPRDEPGEPTPIVPRDMNSANKPTDQAKDKGKGKADD